MAPSLPTDPEAAREIDLRAEHCPMTFVRTRVALEPLEVGEVLRVLLSDPESVRSVPRSLEAEGCDVFDETQEEAGHFSFLVQKTKLVPW